MQQASIAPGITEQSTNVIVIGAGASGLSAAHHLLNYGFSTIVLEASDRFGGRVQKNTNFCDYAIEMGGEELYNPHGYYFEMCLKQGADIYKRKDKAKFVENPAEERLMRIDEFAKRYPKEADVVELLFKHYQKYPRDLRPLSELWEYFALDPMFHFWGEECLGTDNGGDWNQISNVQMGARERIFPTFTDCFLIRNMSHQDILQKGFSDALKCIQYGKEVKEINYKGEQVVVKTGDGSIYRADYVVVTVSIALIKRNSIAFLPDLAPSKKEAIAQIGADPGGKLFLKFKKPVLRQDAVLVYLDFKNVYGWVTSDERSKNDFVMVFSVVGEAQTTEVDANPDKFVKDLLNHLQRLTSENVHENFSAFHWKNWGADRFVQCSQSYDTTRTKKKARKILAENILEKVFFAGEATDYEGRHGCINGAVDTGIRVAREILDISNSRSAPQLLAPAQAKL